ncbi:MAG: FtsX-like permease family protein [Longimicrobiales bacterium]|nr:FtsX-like permease family protein [Longimicrobiales bacterium]
MRLLTRASLRYLTGHRLQLLLSVLGVALGVAVVLSIDLAIQSARTGFRISAETVSGRATHVVTSDVGFVDDSLLARLRIDLDVEAAAPVVEGYATSARLPGRALRILGIDPFSEGPFRPYVAGGPNGVDVGTLLTTRRGVVLASGLARAGGLSVGDSLPVTVEGEAWTLPVAAVIQPGDELARAGLADVLLMDVAGAQEVLRMAGRLSRIDLRFEDDDRGRSRLEAVRSALPADVGVQSVGTRSETMSGMIAAFDVNLTALSLLALIFGMFLIYNAVTFSVVQRRQILGRLRALGVTRGEIVRMILSEALWIGVVGALLGRWRASSWPGAWWGWWPGPSTTSTSRSRCRASIWSRCSWPRDGSWASGRRCWPPSPRPWKPRGRTLGWPRSARWWRAGPGYWCPGRPFSASGSAQPGVPSSSFPPAAWR